MGFGGTPEDKSDRVAQIEAQAAREAREAQEAKDRQAREDFDRRLEAAFGSGKQSAVDYFSGQGLDPTEYLDEIDQAALRTRQNVPILSDSPGTYFDSLGQQVFEREQDTYRNRNLREIEDIATRLSPKSRIQNTADDEIINAILDERKSTAQEYIDNLLGRGVITESGYQGALENLLGQESGARSRLDELGMGFLEEGRGGAESIFNEGRRTASNLRLGQDFDPFAVSDDASSYYTDFFTKLGDKLRGSAPTDLFKTSGLANVAGAASGAQNTRFNPKALAGIFEDEEDDVLSSTSNPF